MRLRTRLALWGPVVLYLGLLFFLSGQREIPGAEYFWDKLLHTCAYAVLGVLMLRASHGGLGDLRPWPAVASVLFTIGYGITDEVHQSFVPGRFSSSLDVAADAVGAIVALVAVLVYTYSRRGERP